MSRKSGLPQGASVRPLSASELDVVAGGLIKTPPVCKPIYRPAPLSAPTV
jgi:hypothetical protein